MPASLPRTRTLLTSRRRWRNRVSVRRRASGRVHYNYFRDYDPAVGRYDESDPTGLRDGVNTYGYVHARPTMEGDPFGLGRGAAAPPSTSTEPVAVSVRCGGIYSPTWSGGIGGMHCEVVATCKKTGETIGFGIGGPPGLSNQIGGGSTPPKYQGDRSPKPPGDVDQYEATCGEGGECDGCAALACFKKMQAGNKPPPYYALAQNSNSYAHHLLNQCGCQLKTGMRGPPGAVAW